MQEWVAWGNASGLAEDDRREAADWVASWGAATLTVVAIVLPVISILVAVAVSH